MTRHDEPPETAGATKRQRIAKLMARAGLCSRRDAEAWIVDGRVSVNGEILTSPALDVSDDDAILVDGVHMPTAEKTRLFLFHKPRGLVTSDHDPEGRETVIDYLRDHWPDGPRVVTIGRLDINTEGLLLLTNDGGLARMLELPQTGWVRRYRVRAKGMTDPGTLDALAAGVTIDGIDYAGIEAKLDRVQGANCWLTMGLREGKNREVKRVLEHIGLEVNRLIRLSFGPFQLLDLPEGAVEEVRTRVLRDQLGENLAAQAGVDFGDSEPTKIASQERASREARPSTPREARPSTPREARTPREGQKGDGPSAPRGRPTADRSTRPSTGRPARPPSDRTTRPRTERRDDRDDAPPPQRERPVAGTRKHVSTLRATGSEAERRGPRKRIERTDTQDRRDRTIKVERLVSTRPTSEAPRRSRVSPSGPGARDPNKRFPRGEAERRPDARPRSAERPEGRPRPSRPEGNDRRRDDTRPAPREGRPAPQESRFKPREDRPRSQEARTTTRHGDSPATPRRHASPSALGKRERMSRSGAAQQRFQDRPAGADHDAGYRPDAGKKIRSARPEPDRGPPRGDRRPDAAQRERRPDPDKRERRPGGERGERRGGTDKGEGRRPDGERKTRPRPAADRHETRRDDKAPRPAGRPMGAASRKPSGNKPAGRKPQGAGAPRSFGTRAPGRDAAPRGKPRGPDSRGPSKPKR